MSFKQLKQAAAAAACLLALAVPAKADNLQQSLTTIPQAWLGNVAQPIRLNNGGAVVVPFINPLGGIVSVTYTAECQLVGAPTSYIHLTIFIDNVLAAPTGPDAAFCSGRGVGLAGGWSRNSITVTRLMAPGNHIVRINGQVSGVHTGARLDDTTIVITR